MAAPPDVRLKRFLHYGSEEGLYVPGPRVFTPKSAKCIGALIGEGKATEVVLQIVKAHNDGYAVHRDALVFALAVCARNKESVPMKEAAYSAVKTVCTRPSDLFLFIRYCLELGDKKSTGHGFKRAVSEWYLKKDPLELADVITKQRSYGKWSHRDLIKLAHLSTKDIAKQAVLCYAVNNLKTATEKFANEKEAQLVMQFLTAVEDVRTSTDEKFVVRTIESYSLALEHVPSNNQSLIKSKEVWCALVPSMPLIKLLDFLQRVSINQLLKGGNVGFVRRYCDALMNPTTLAESGLHPARIFIELRTYELRAKEKIDLAIKMNHESATKKNSTPPKPNSFVVDSLTKLVESSFKLLVPTGLRYLIAIDGRDRLWKSRCYKCRFVTSGEAAILVALSLLKTEREVVLGTFTGPQGLFTPIETTREENMVELIAKVKCQLGENRVASFNPAAKNVFDWCEQNKKLIDVFIVMGDNTLQVAGLGPDLALFRRTMQLQNAKMVTCCFNGPCKRKKTGMGNGLLSVFGFDHHVPRVIEAFARGAF